MNVTPHSRRLRVGALLASGLFASVLATTSGVARADATGLQPAPCENAIATALAGPAGASDQSATPTKLITVVGTVSEGVEAGCLILNATNGQSYQLLAVNPTTLPKTKLIRVTGSLRPDILTTCQQGVPLLATKVSPA